MAYTDDIDDFEEPDRARDADSADSADSAEEEDAMDKSNATGAEKHDADDVRMDDDDDPGSADEDAEVTVAHAPSDARAVAENADPEEGDGSEENGASGKKGGKQSIPNHLHHKVNPDELHEMRSTCYHMMGKFGQYIKFGIEDNKGSVVLEATNSFELGPDDNLADNEQKSWQCRLNKNMITILNIKGSQRGKRPIGSFESRNIAFLRVKETKDGVVYDKRLTPVTQHMMYLIWHNAKVRMNKPDMSEKTRDAWNKLLNSMFFDVYGTQSSDAIEKLVSASSPGVWLLNTRRDDYEKCITENNWHRYTLSKNDKPASKPTEDTSCPTGATGSTDSMQCTTLESAAPAAASIDKRNAANSAEERAASPAEQVQRGRANGRVNTADKPTKPRAPRGKKAADAPAGTPSVSTAANAPTASTLQTVMAMAPAPSMVLPPASAPAGTCNKRTIAEVEGPIVTVGSVKFQTCTVLKICE